MFHVNILKEDISQQKNDHGFSLWKTYLTEFKAPQLFFFFLIAVWDPTTPIGCRKMAWQGKGDKKKIRQFSQSSMWQDRGTAV